MNLSDQQIEKFTTLGFMTVGFLLIVFAGSKSMDFQRKCDSKCGDQPAVTPLMGLEEQCLCGEGHGRWRKEEVGTGD